MTQQQPGHGEVEDPTPLPCLLLLNTTLMMHLANDMWCQQMWAQEEADTDMEVVLLLGWSAQPLKLICLVVTLLLQATTDFYS